VGKKSAVTAQDFTGRHSIIVWAEFDFQEGVGPTAFGKPAAIGSKARSRLEQRLENRALCPGYDYHEADRTPSSVRSMSFFATRPPK